MKQVQINEDNLVRYGIDNHLASKAAQNGLTVTKIRTLSVPDLINLFRMTEIEAGELKKRVVRAPIDKDIVSQLLSASNFTCNVCKGVKSHAYIIHHINPYEQTQDNSYGNLIVLCPSDHDLAHRPGALTLGIGRNELVTQKSAWEAQVRTLNANAATRIMASNILVNVPLNRHEDVRTLRYLMYFIPFTLLSSHIQYLPNAFDINFLDVATHMETLMLDRPHGYPFTDPLLQQNYGDYLEKYIVLYRLIDGGTRGIPHFLSADDVGGSFISRRNRQGFSYAEDRDIAQALQTAAVQFVDSYHSLIWFLRQNYPEVSLDAYNHAFPI